MKLFVLFLVLSMVVLMAEPGDAFFHHIWKGLKHVGRFVGKMFTRPDQNNADQQQQSDQQQP